MKKNLTELVFIIDRSGSMMGLETDTIGGFNATLAKHAEMEGEAIVSTVLFDHEAFVLHDRIPVKEVAPMTTKDYQVRGCTALLDAVGGSIKHIERVQRYLPETHQAEHVIFVITTDGFENASHRYTYDQVRSTIERKKADGWEFLFLGANIDAVDEAARMGISADRSVTYLADEEGTRVMNDAVMHVTCALRDTGSFPPVGATWKEAVERDTAKRGNTKSNTAKLGFFRK